MSFLNDLMGIKGKVTLSHFAIGDFTLDAIVEESFDASVTLTESAIESGARISDHKIKNPRAFVIRGTIVNYETKDTISQVFPEADALFNKVQLPASISSVTEYTRATVNRYAGIVKGYIQTASKVYDAYNKLGEIKSITDIPNLLNDTSETDDRIIKIKNTLEALCFSEDFLTVTTSGGEYTQVSIISSTVVRVGASANVTIVCREVPTFNVERVSGINAIVKNPAKKAEDQNKPASNKKSDQSSKQSAEPKNKGKTQPQKSKKSALKSITESVGGLF